MALMNLFSKPLDFKCTESGNEKAAALRDTRATPVELISKPLVMPRVGMPNNNLQRGINMINDSSHHGHKKRKSNKSLKKNKLTKYEDYDSLMNSCENRNSSMENWPGSKKNALAPDHDSFERSVVCYEDPVFSSSNSKKQRSKQLKAAKKNNNNNINNNNIKNNNNTGNKKKSKNKMPHVKDVSQKHSDNILNEAAPNYLSFGFSDSLKTLDASCSIFGGPDGKSLKRKADDVDESRSKLRRVYDEWAPIFDDKKLAVEPIEVTKMKNTNPKDPLSKSKLRKIEKSKQFWEKRREKESRYAAHQQGLQKKIVPCKFYVNGCCSKGTECTFSHDIPQVKKDEPCKFYVMSQCTKEGCLYRHGEWPCKFFHGQKGCRSNNCKFSHESLTEITKKWLDKIFEGDSANKSETGEKEDKVEEFKVECTVDSFYGSSANQTLPDVMQPKREAEVHSAAGQPLDTNKIDDVSTWRCSWVPKSSDNFDIIRMETPRKQHASLFEFFKNKIESHRSNEFRDRHLCSSAETLISQMPICCSQNSIAHQPHFDSNRCNSFDQGPVLASSFKPSINIQHYDKGLQAPIKTNSDFFCSPSSTMVVPERNKHKSKGMMSLTTDGSVSSPVIKPVLADNCRSPASRKVSGISYIPSLTTKTSSDELKSNEILSYLVQNNERITHIKGDSGLFSASQLNGSIEMEFNYDKEEAKPIEKQRALVKELSETYEKIPTNNKELSTSPNMFGLFSTPLSFSFTESEVAYDQSKSKLKNMDNSYDSDILTNHPVINATLQTSSSIGCMLQDDNVNGFFSTPLSSSINAGVPCGTTELESNKKTMLLKDDEASIINQRFPSNQQLSTNGHMLFSTPLSFPSNKTHLNSGKIELGNNGKMQTNEALNNVEAIITTNPESSISLNNLGLFSKPLSFSSTKSELICDKNKSKCGKSSKNYLNCYSDLTTFPTPSCAELNGLFSTPLSFSLVDADTSSITNEKMPNVEILNINPRMTSIQELSSSNNLGLFSTPLSFSTKTEIARDIEKKNSSKSVKDYLTCHSVLNNNLPIPSSKKLDGLPHSLSSVNANTLPSTNESYGKLQVTEALNNVEPIIINQKPSTSTNMIGIFATTSSLSTIKTKTKSIASKSKSKKMADSLVSHPLICHSITNTNLPIPTTTKVTGLSSISLVTSSTADKSGNSNELELNKNEMYVVSQATVDHHLSAKAPALFSIPLSFTPVKASDAKDLKSQDKLNSLNKKIMVSKTNKPISIKNKAASELFSVPFSSNSMKTEPKCGTKKTMKSVKDHLSPDFGLKPTSTKVTGLFSNPLSFPPEIPPSANESESIEKATLQVNRGMNQQLSAKLFSTPLLFSPNKTNSNNDNNRLKLNEKVKENEALNNIDPTIPSKQKSSTSTNMLGLFSTPLSFTATKSEVTCVTSKLNVTNSLVLGPLTCHSIDANQQVLTTPTETLFSTPLSFSSTKADISGIRNELNYNENVTPFQNHTTSTIGRSNVSTNLLIPASAKLPRLFSTPLAFHLTNPESTCDTRELKSKDKTSLLAKDPLIFQPISDANLQTPTEAFGFSSTEFKSEQNEMNLRHQNQMPHAGNSNMQIDRNELATGLFLTPLLFPSSNGDINPETSEPTPPKAVHRTTGLFVQDNNSHQKAKAIVARK